MSRSPQDTDADVIVETDGSGEVKDVKTVANGSAGQPAERSHGLPPGPARGDTTMLEALSLACLFLR